MSGRPTNLQLVRNATKHGGVWKKTSSATTRKTVRTNILSYLDDTTKKEKRLPGEATIRNGIHYLAKNPRSRIGVYGFLREDIQEREGKLISEMADDELIMGAHSAWDERLEWKAERSRGRPLKVTCHKFVLSLHRDQSELLRKVFRDPDTALKDIARTVMRRYQEKYYPGEKLGFLVGVHRDKPHLHAHVMLFPTTGEGKKLRVTSESRERKGRDPFKFMRETADREVRKFVSREFEQPTKLLQRDFLVNYQPKLLLEAATVNYYQGELKAVPPKEGPEREEFLTWILAERKRLSALPEEQLRKELDKAYARENKRWEVGRETLSPEQVDGRLEMVRENRKNLCGEIEAASGNARALSAEAKSHREMGIQMRKLKRGFRMILRSGLPFKASNGIPDKDFMDWMEQMRSADPKTSRALWKKFDEIEAKWRSDTSQASDAKAVSSFRNPTFKKLFRECLEGAIRGPRQTPKWKGEKDARTEIDDLIEAAANNAFAKADEAAAKRRREWEKIDKRRAELQMLDLRNTVYLGLKNKTKPYYLRQQEAARRMGIRYPVDGAARSKVNIEDQMGERMQSDASVSRESMRRLEEIWRRSKAYEMQEHAVANVVDETVSKPAPVLAESTQRWIRDVEETIKASKNVYIPKIAPEKQKREEQAIGEKFAEQFREGRLGESPGADRSA